MRGAKFDIEKFDETGDFGLWRVKMRALLIQHGCEVDLKVLPEDMEAQAKAELNKKAHSVVILCLDKKVLREVSGETTAAGVWTKLETLYMTKSLANKLCLKKKLYTFYILAGRNISEHIDEFNKIVLDLANIEDNAESLNYRPYLGPKDMEALRGIHSIKGTVLHTSSLGITLRRMSAMANTTLIVTTVTKPVTNPRDADATPRVNIQDFCEEYYKDILPIIMDKVRRDKRKEVHARLDFREGSRERRTREGSHYSSARTLSARPERLKVRDRLRYNDRHVLDQLGNRRQSAFDRLSKNYSPSTTKSRPGRTSSRDRSRGRSRHHRLDASNGDRPENKECFRGVGESYDNSHSSYGTEINHEYRYHDRDRSRHMKRGRDNESLLSSVSKSDSSDGRHWKSKSKRHKPTNEDDLTMPWMWQHRWNVGHWAMPTWCHMFNSTLIGAARVWFDELPPESIDSYKDPKEAFLAYFMEQKKYVKDPVEIHKIKQKDEETIEDFMERFKVETRRMKGAPECMWIFGFMHGVNNPELTKRLNEHVPKTMEEMMITTTASIRGEAAAGSKKRSHIEEFVRAGKFSHLIKEIKHGRDQSKVRNKETPAKDKPTAIYMIQSWQRMTRQKVTQSFKRVREITFPSLATSSGTEGPLVIEAEIGGHMIHRMYVDGGSSTEVLYEHCFNRLQPKIKNQIVPATTSLTGFSEKTIWPLGQLRLLVTIGDADHSTRAWINFMIVRSLSPYNGITERPGIKEIQAVPSIAHGMLKFPADGGIVTIRSTILIPTECATVITSSKEMPKEADVRHENFKVALHPNFSDEEVEIEGTLSAKGRTELCSLLKENLDIFDCYPLLKIDWKVESLGGYPFKFFLDAYKGYHQIQLAESDEEKMVFHTGQGVYCYAKMPFGLKNDGATYQRLVDKAFNSQIAKRLRRYFQAHPIAVITDQPIKQIMSRPDVLADFLAEMPDKSPPDASIVETQQEPWTIFTYGSSCMDGSGARLLLTSPKGTEFTYALRFQFAATNNEAEYEALIASLRITAQMGVQNVYVSVDSKLVVNQVLGAYVAKEENMIKYLEKVKSLVSGFTNFSINQVPRSKNKKADALSKIASTSFPHLSKQVLVEILKEKCIQEKEVTTLVEKHGPTWMTPIMEYLKEWALPSDIKEARKLRIKARQYELLEGVLYRQSFLTSWLRCVGPLQADYVIREIHKESCNMHTGPCPQQPLTPITAPWPFYKWGINIAGPFSKAPGLPGEIVSNNGKQFSDNPFKDWCDKLNITQRFASVKHPQSNGLVERANRSLGEGIKARLGEGNKNWVEELPHVLWAHHTMIKSSHGDTPFSLTYGTEAVIPAEIGIPTYRTAAVDVYYNARVRGVTFRPGDFVYRSNDASHAVDRGKLGPNCEGPYEVTEALGDEACKLRSMDGTVLPRT
uniref:Reverse transcriptase domain-containing protein n=1 Tax=Tanacetum cinerariifolium TaxID=118510 RepID=A0A6L2LD69_TANCI|nr:reverse transcriptase domain-containing protein [Tanacetum cinerariifolium]